MKIIKFKASAGLTVHLMKFKTNLSYFFLGTPFGGNVLDFFTTQGKKVSVPSGIAHFLEHKMFDKKKYDFSKKLADWGSNTNAFTASDNTNYQIFAFQKKFENLRALFDLVFDLELDQKSVDKERGIILSELKMYQDKPAGRIWDDINQVLFHSNYAAPTLGSAEDISKNISLKNLRACHENFYHPNQMLLTVVGNHSPKEIKNWVEKILKEKKLGKKNPAEILPFNEKKEVKKKRLVDESHSPTPYVGIGFKFFRDSKTTQRELVAAELLPGWLLAKSSPLYEELKQKKLIDHSFFAEFVMQNGKAYLLICGNTPKPKEFEQTILNGIKKYGKKLNEKDFERVRKKNLGGLILMENHPASLGGSYVQYYYSGIKFDEQKKLIEQASLTDVKKAFGKLFDFNNCSVVLLKPKKEK